jgi:seryl-tRNA synthetase
MLDIKRIRKNPEILTRALQKSNGEISVDEIFEWDEARRSLLTEVEQIKAKQNADSKQIPILKKEGKDVSGIMGEMKLLSANASDLDKKVKEIDEKLDLLLLSIPNVPGPEVPEGKSEADNVEVSKWGEPRKFDFEVKAHWDIGEDLDILDFAMGAKVTGARFTFYKGAGARLERALINFMMDLHADKNGYTEVLPPYMVNSASATGTGQLPKFSQDMFKIVDTDYYMIPTAEVPVTNMYREQILDVSQLPIWHCAYSACFRSEAGAAGRDTRGLIRQHQFNKVELVKFTTPETSYAELETLRASAESVLRALNLPYRVVNLCVADLGFSAAQTYDLEVWMPSYGRYVEISSCSNFEDFQARRAGIRFRRSQNDKVEYVHTLNGSGLAVGRTTACVLETYQQPDGSIVVPEVLRPYMGGLEVIK